MNILDEIVSRRKERIKRLGFTLGCDVPATRTRDVVPFIDSKGVVLEVKRASPSKGDIAPGLNAAETAAVYCKAGAAAISVLTEEEYFKGSLNDLMAVCRAVDEYVSANPEWKRCAVLRKDFLLYEEEVDVAWRCGADAVLLIARILDEEKLVSMVKECAQRQLTAFVELRESSDIEKIKKVFAVVPEAKIVCGVNARDLKDFTIDLLIPLGILNTICDAAKDYGRKVPVVFESGIRSPAAASFAGSLGFDGMLLGEAAARNPAVASSLVASFVSGSPSPASRFWTEYTRRLNIFRASNPRRPVLKICGVTTEEDAVYAAKSGAALIGMIFSEKSPRCINAQRAKNIAAALEKNGLRDSVFLIAVITETQSPVAQEAVSLVKSATFDALQLHGFDCAHAFILGKDSALAHFCVVSIMDAQDVGKIDMLCNLGEPRVLIDAASLTAAGGTGCAIDDDLVDLCNKKIRPWIAGGVNPSTVEHILARGNVELLDVCSGVEKSPGIKDHAKIEELIKKDRWNTLEQQEQMMNSTDGFFDMYGGKYVAEVLRRPLDELEDAFNKYMHDKDFLDELAIIQRDYIGRETPLYYAPTATKLLGGAQIYIKLEGLANTGAHKINNAIGQCLLAKKMGKKRIIAETGAGQHGLATAAACAKLGLECVVYMGEVDVRRQQPNVAAMEMYGATVRPVTSGSRTLKDAVNEAMRDWAANFETTHYVLGSALGPAPFPDMVREFQSVIGKEVKRQCEERGVDIGAMVACVGGGSNSIGFFSPFIDKKEPRLIGAEAGGIGPGVGENASRMTGNAARDGIMQGYKSRFLLDDDGQALPTRSISAGLDYCGIGPQLAALGKSGRVEFVAVRDKEALEAVSFFAKNEGILFALESAHAGAAAMRIAKELPKDKAVIINMSGRGDKDIFITSPVFRPESWKEFLKAELERLDENVDIHNAKIMG